MDKLHIITPVKDSIDLTLQTIKSVKGSNIRVPFIYKVYNDFSTDESTTILEEASKLENIAKSKEVSEELKGKILGLMFFEPSTRTRMSFETAMKRLGGEGIGFESSGSSSVSKGESIADTAKMFEGYSDALVIRHELEGVSK
ncbi:MAG: hypothetical protein J6O49_17205, partial [Bacteroidaceae bacterium]|nr:hypothetical protein [Bacteroidaceae bacterium]